MATINKKGPKIYLFEDNTDVGATSDDLTRYNYDSNTIYIINPNGVEISIEVSPDAGQNWFETLPATTDTQAIHQLELNFDRVRAVRGTGAGPVSVLVMSSGVLDG